ncbi:HMG-box domain-containing protein [Aspergillus glaucus CBS 516.65]|uniref:HMG box domain-containing protein n=1 Tax=Aspergillus glaucus CBS 516.65 TaxID=1160497 RepID=A0A1L9VDV0_ASPGL|nr:hypothetical protein ASPGLDRAFT_49531 [Aspergillus glaucus CBS 516.65]OJJ82121.1 hypothetical protein ASPGLDRAFT_49531 [Aspergillus glaucus CBS 516.65]
MLPMQYPIAGHPGLINTPPPTADESVVPGGLGSTSPWSVPKPSSAKPRVSRAPRIQRRNKKLKERSKPTVTAPLSESTKHMTHIPLRDMESWVHRPIKTRMQEVAKRNGSVARPMNSFMLYRSAYAERAKQLITETKHQKVSEAAGESWKIESRETREKYELLASIEKSNHLKAHPGYKFSPSKKDKSPDEVRSEPGPEQRPSPMSSPSFAQSGRGMSCGVESGGWDSRDFTPFDQDHGLPSASYLSSSWQTGHPGRPFTGMDEAAHHYIPSSVPAGLVNLQELQYSSSTALAGLPGGTHHDLLQPQTSIPTPGSFTDGQLDPQLLKRDTASPAQVYHHNGAYHPMWQEGPTYLPATTSMPSNAVPYTIAGYQPGMQTLLDNRESWESSQEANVDGPNGGDFDHWINPHPTGY